MGLGGRRTPHGPSLDLMTFVWFRACDQLVQVVAIIAATSLCSAASLARPRRLTCLQRSNSGPRRIVDMRGHTESKGGSANATLASKNVSQILALLRASAGPQICSQINSATGMRPHSNPPSFSSHARRWLLRAGWSCWKLWPSRDRCSYLATLLSFFQRPRSLMSTVSRWPRAMSTAGPV